MDFKKNIVDITNIITKQRNEIENKVNSVKQDAKDKWDGITDKVEDVTSDVVDRKDKIVNTTNSIKDELKGSYKRISDHLSK